MAIGAAVLIAIAVARGELAGLPPYAGVLVLVAVCDVAAPFTALSYGEQHVSSSLAGILVGATPLFVGLLAVGFDADERPGAAAGSVWRSGSPASPRCSASA